MAVMHDFECRAHGHFEARAKAGTIPKCPKGCSKSFVTLVYLRPVGVVSARTRKADSLVREAAEMQGLSDISTSPSRPGGSVAHRNRLKARHGRDFHENQLARSVPVDQYLGAMTNKANVLANEVGLGHKYDPQEWKKSEDGKMRHVGAQGPTQPIPVGTRGVSIERVREKPK